MVVVLVRRFYLLINSSVSFLSLLHSLLLYLQHRHAVILLDQQFGVGERSRLSDEKWGLCELLRWEPFIRFLLLLFQHELEPLGRTHTTHTAYLLLIRRSLRGALWVCILRWLGGAWWILTSFFNDKARTWLLLLWTWRRIWVWWLWWGLGLSRPY